LFRSSQESGVLELAALPIVADVNFAVDVDVAVDVIVDVIVDVNFAVDVDVVVDVVVDVNFAVDVGIGVDVGVGIHFGMPLDLCHDAPIQPLGFWRGLPQSSGIVFLRSASFLFTAVGFQLLARAQKPIERNGLDAFEVFAIQAIVGVEACFQDRECFPQVVRPFQSGHVSCIDLCSDEWNH
jgi:hypothetical protein